MKDAFTDRGRARKTRDRLDLPITSRAFDRSGSPGADDYDRRDEFVWEQVSNSWSAPPPSRWFGRLVFAVLGGALAVGAMFAVNVLRGDESPLRLEPTVAVDQQAATTPAPVAPSDAPASEPSPDPHDLPPLVDPAPVSPTPQVASPPEPAPHADVPSGAPTPPVSRAQPSRPVAAAPP